MTAGLAPGISTWDVTPTPYRPGLADVNGASLLDDAENPPDASSMPTSALLNTLSQLVITFGKMLPNAIFSVTGGNPPVLNLWTAAPNAPTQSTWTITRVGAGNVQITWPAGTFPPAVTAPTVSLNITGGLVATHNYSISAENITNGVQVTTQYDGTRTDLSFTVVVR